jgi:hypothetical protein
MWNKMRIILSDKEYSERIRDRIRDIIYDDFCLNCDEKKCIMKENVPHLTFLIGCFLSHYPEHLAKAYIEECEEIIA